MSSIRGISIKSILTGLGLFALPFVSNAQLLVPTADKTAPDSVIRLTAEAQGLERIAPESLPPFGTFWLVGSNGFAAPYPCLPPDAALVYRMTDGQYLIDGTDGQVSLNRRQTNATVEDALAAQAASVVALIAEVQAPKVQRLARTMSLDGGPLPPGPGESGDGGTNVYYPAGLDYTPPDYGTNLWIAQFTITNGYLAGVASNTIADVPYEVLSNTNLTTTNWVSTGLFLYGSETTNWTAFITLPVSRTNGLFFRLRSWADDGSGLPIWFEQQYGVTDPYGDPDGDGWNNLQELQNGTSPLSFNPPPAPQGLTVALHQSGQTSDFRWLPAPGAVTGYTVEKTDAYASPVTVQTYALTANATSFTDDISSNGDARYYAFYGHSYGVAYRVQAHYAGGASAWSAAAPLQAPTVAGAIVAGADGGTYLAVTGLPADAVTVQLVYVDEGADVYEHDASFDVVRDLSAAAFTNGLQALPAAWRPPTEDAYGAAIYDLYLRSVDAAGNASKSVLLASGWLGWAQYYHWDEPFYDGRVALKQNLIFQFRIADTVTPFGLVGYTDDPQTGHGQPTTLSTPTSYVHAGFYDINNPNGLYGQIGDVPFFNPYRPFEDNTLYRNFVFDPALLDTNGILATGAHSDPYVDDGLHLGLQLPPTYLPTTNVTAFAPLLDTNSTRWLAAYQAGQIYFTTYPGVFDFLNGLTYDTSLNLHFASHAVNYWGLSFVSAKVFYLNDNNVNVHNTILNPGDSLNYVGPTAIYMETAQPQFQTVEYDFWQNDGSDRAKTNTPGSYEFSPTNASDLLLAGVGQSLPISAYAKLKVLNGYEGVYGYLAQYLDQAHTLDDNGTMTTNRAGIVSPYGTFFATEAGAAALITMPDPDTGERGTGIVYAVSAVIDRTQGSNMDLSFNGPNATSANNPAQIWVNNNYDRGHTVDGNDFEQDDLGPTDVANGHLVPDYQYMANGLPAIPSTRDLEDYFRLWLPGVAAAMKAMPNNYTVQLTLTGDAQIRIFQAVEPDGGTNYLFDETTASNQVANSTSLYVGLLTSGSPIVFNITTNFNEHFIFCGAQTGTAQIDLQILDGNQNLVADAPVYLQIKDIKQMYERWTVGENPKVPPLSVATPQVDNLAFQYAPPTDASTPYILFVHGWNQETWEKDRYAETVFKRLYWQGYQGRFGLYRWPTGNKFSDKIDVLLDARNYDNSEYQAWQSATGLTNLLTGLDAEYPGNVYLLAHSMGNVVAGETLRRAGRQLVNTYVAMQGAVPAHAYDPTTTTRAIVPNSFGLGQDDNTPNRYAEYYTNGAPCYFASSAGAGAYVNFYNATDYALAAALWQFDQNLKPDGGLSLPYPGYYYNSSSNFYRINGSIVTYLNFPTNTYELFAYGVEARCYAIGAQADVGGVFMLNGANQQVDSQTLWPADTHPHLPGTLYSAHVWHSAEFRSDNMSRAAFWNTVLNRMNLLP